MLHINNLLAYIRDSIFMTNVVIVECFQSMIIGCYIIPVFIMFASTFKSTHWLVPGYCLGQIACLERSVAMTVSEPKQR